MKRSDKPTVFFYSLVVAYAMLIQACTLLGQKKGDRGELSGLSGRVGWKMEAPAGMVFIPGGSFTIVSAGQDEIARITPPKQAAVSSFYIDTYLITNNQYHQFIDTLLAAATAGEEEQGLAEGQEGEYPSRVAEDGEANYSAVSEEFVMQNLYPDMTRWQKDFDHQMADPMVEQYYEHVAFDNFPVVGITWEAATYFAAWRTQYLNEYREERGLWPMPEFRLPTASEWTYAARGGDQAFPKYPWGGPYVRDEQGKLLANFKSGRGNYKEVKYDYTAPVDHFPANGYGLHMGGNVAEWTSDAYSPAATARVWDLNPVCIEEDQSIKIVKGGSWKDIARFVQTDAVDYEHKDNARSYIGFRCVMSHIGKEPN